MDTILNYFNNIFLALPVTEEVQRAKDELLNMAEDRYHDLKEQGKTENEAVGTVIEEFGNIDELAAELGLSFGTEEIAEQTFFSQNDAENFLDTWEKADRQLGAGVFLLFISPILLIIMGLLNSGWRPVVSTSVIACIGTPFLLVFIAIGLCLIIFSSFSRKPFRYLEREIFQMDYSTAAFVEDKYKEQQKNFVLRIMLAISLLIVGVIPLIMMGVFFDTVPLLVRGIAVDAFMVMYGLSIYNFICAGMSQKRFKIIKQLERFSQKKKQKWLKRRQK